MSEVPGKTHENPSELFTLPRLVSLTDVHDGGHTLVCLRSKALSEDGIPSPEKTPQVHIHSTGHSLQGCIHVLFSVNIPSTKHHAQETSAQ